MAKGIITGGGGGGSLDPKGSINQPIYIDSQGDSQACTSINLPIKCNNSTQSTVVYVLGVNGTTGGNYSPIIAYNASGTNNQLGIRFNPATGVLMGAAWNDYAEYRICDEVPGTCVCETGFGNLNASSERLQAGGNIVSDTCGLVIGQDDLDYKPIAVSGRVLAYVDDSEFEAGDAVCAAPGGVVSKMTRQEIKEYPDRIVGYVSEIPSYSTWNGVEINNRIWIKVN